MRKYLLPAAAVVAVIAASCGGNEADKDASVIDIASAVANPVELKVSDLGKTIRYVPLETNDSVLVGNTWAITPADGGIYLSNYSRYGGSNTNCLSFDYDGKFIASVGHIGQDPEAYWTSQCLLAPDNKTAYFAGSTAMQHYDLEGKYLGRTPRNGIIGFPGNTGVVDTTFICVSQGRAGAFGPEYMSIMSEGMTTEVVDTTVIIPAPEDWDGRTVFSNVSITNVHGVMLNDLESYSEYQMAGKYMYRNGDNRRIWRVGDELHFRNTLRDTISILTPTSITPLYTFDCGPNAVTEDFLNTFEQMPSNALVVADIIETKDRIIFGASIGWMNYPDHKPFMGYFEKATGKTVATQAEKGFIDDIEGFMPFNPVIAAPDGTLIGILTVDDIDKYLEKNPGAELPASLKGLEPDANPILVFVK